MELTRDQRLHLRALAHGLQPVVMIGSNGLTDSVIREIAVNLDAHELIKVRVFGDDRAQREAWLTAICDALGCSPVQHIGKLLVLYRPTEEKKVSLSPEKPVKIAKPTASSKPSKTVDQGRGNRNRSTKKR